jgi:hypothetical protein
MSTHHCLFTDSNDHVGKVEMVGGVRRKTAVPATTGRSAMVAAKGERKSAEEAWAVVAAANGYRCAQCGTVPPHAERATFFARDLCGWCADAMDKDDRTAARSS